MDFCGAPSFEIQRYWKSNFKTSIQFRILKWDDGWRCSNMFTSLVQFTMGWGEVYLGVMFRVLLESKTSSFNDLPSIVKINTKFGMQACMYSMPGCGVSNDWITSTNSHSSPGCGMRWISFIVMNVSLSSVVRSIGSLQYQHVHHCFSMKVYRSKLAWSHPNSMRAPLQRPPPQKKSDTSMFHIQNLYLEKPWQTWKHYVVNGGAKLTVDNESFCWGEALCQASLPSAGDVRRLQCWRDPTPVEVDAVR